MLPGKGVLFNEYQFLFFSVYVPANRDLIVDFIIVQFSFVGLIFQKRFLFPFYTDFKFETL